MNSTSTELNQDDTFVMDEEEELVGYLGTPEDAVYPEKKIDERPAEERIADLLKNMAPRRKVLLGTIAFCEEAQPVSEVNTFIDGLQSDNFSVFSAGNLCTLLEEAGALSRITEDGEPAEDTEPEPKTVVVDGVEYLEPGESIEVFWVATAEGLEVVEADKPLERLQELFEADAKYLSVYKQILSMCNQEDGVTVSEINSAVDHHELVQKPRLFAPHFIDKLEKYDAVEWKKNWIATDIGKQGLELLVDIAALELPVEDSTEAKEA